MPMPPELKKIRQEIDYNFKEFKKIIDSKKFKSVYGDLSRSSEYSLVNVPQGFEKDNPAAEDLKLKSYVGMKKIKEADLTSKELEKQVAEAFEALQPRVEFINRALKD